MHKVFLSILTAITALTVNAQTTPQKPTDAVIKWYSIEEAQALNAKAPRKFFIDMYTTWCGWCRVMDANTFSQPDIIQYMNTYFYPVKFNAEGKDAATFAGQAFKKQQNMQFHDLAIALMQGQMSFPTSIFLYENLQPFTIVPGYLPPEKLRPILVFIAQNYYQKMNFDDFSKQWPDILNQQP